MVGDILEVDRTFFFNKRKTEFVNMYPDVSNSKGW